LEDVAQECRLLGAPSAQAVAVDVCDAMAVQAAVDDVTRQLGRIDAVVHSAGVVAYGRFEDVPGDIFEAVIRTNLFGTANVSRALLPQMRERNAGTIVLVGSLIGQIATPFMSPYAVSKWAVRALARHLQIENRDRAGVHISLLTPGAVDTPIYVQAANYLGRIGRPPPPVIAPEKVAAAALALLDRPRRNPQVGSSNRVITAGFALFPRLYDVIVTPMLSVAAIDRRQRIEPGPGNVLGSVPAWNRSHGGQGSPLSSIAGSVLAAFRPTGQATLPAFGRARSRPPAAPGRRDEPEQ